MSATSPKIVLHWLNHSRSHRILWLLEELELPYELKVYKRDPVTFRAPPELYDVHPLGKSPILEVNGKKLCESGHITNYLINNFDTKKVLKAENEDDDEKIDYFLHYAEGTLQPYLVQLLILESSKAKFPFVLKPLLSRVIDAIQNAYARPEAITNVKYLEKILENQKYFVGDKLTGADIILSFPLESIASGRGGLFEKKDYPNITRWMEEISKRPAYQKANEKIKDI